MSSNNWLDDSAKFTKNDIKWKHSNIWDSVNSDDSDYLEDNKCCFKKKRKTNNFQNYHAELSTKKSIFDCFKKKNTDNF